jgi:regulator of protease activity HflC (stomatin/prohibitin superfamily)
MTALPPSSAPPVPAALAATPPTPSLATPTTITRNTAGMDAAQAAGKNQSETYTFWLFGILMVLATASAFLPWLQFAPGLSAPLFPFAFIAVGAYALISFRTIEAGSVGVKICFGKPLYQLKSGWCFVPRWVFKLNTYTSLLNELNLQSGTYLSKHGITVSETEGKRFDTDPFHVAFGDRDEIAALSASNSSTASSPAVPNNHLFNQLITTDPKVVLRWKIVWLPAFLENVGDVSKCNDLLAETARGALQAVAARLTLATAMKNMAFLEMLIREKIEKLIGEGEAFTSWGIDVTEVQIEDFGAPHDVNKAIARRVIATADRDATITTANGEREKRTLEGQGTANARGSYLKAEAEGAEAMAKVVETEGGKRAATLQAMSTTLGNNSKVVLGGSGSLTDLLAVALAEGTIGGPRPAAPTSSAGASTPPPATTPSPTAPAGTPRGGSATP